MGGVAGAQEDEDALPPGEFLSHAELLEDPDEVLDALEELSSELLLNNSASPGVGLGVGESDTNPLGPPPPPKVIGQIFLRAFGQSKFFSCAFRRSQFRPKNLFGAFSASNTSGSREGGGSPPHSPPPPPFSGKLCLSSESGPVHTRPLRSPLRWRAFLCSMRFLFLLS